MLRVDKDDKRFTAVENTHGVSGADTIFHYRTDGSLITGTYVGAGSAPASSSGALRRRRPSSCSFSASRRTAS